MKSVLVIGATGMLGKPITRQLAEAGFQVTALVRHPEQAQQVLPSTVRLVKGDLADKASIEQALVGQHLIYLNLSVKQTEKPSDFHTETDGLHNLLAAVKNKPIERIAYLSSIVKRYQGQDGFDWWVFRIKHQAVALIKESGIPYTLFYPSTFLETLKMQVQGTRLPLAGKSRFPMHFIAADDYGKMVVKALQQDTGNREYDVQGPVAYTYDEAAERFVRNYPKAKLKIMKLPLWVLSAAGRFNQRMNYGAHILKALNNYPESFTGETAWHELHKPVITIEEFAKNQ